MRNSERVLNSLAKHSRQPDYKFERLYRLLFNEQMYYVAYQRIYAKEGNMTKGADNKTIDRMSISRIEKLISSLKDESYQPIASRRVYIPKKMGRNALWEYLHSMTNFCKKWSEWFWKQFTRVVSTWTHMGSDLSAAAIRLCDKSNGHLTEHAGLLRETSKVSLTTLTTV